MLKGLQIAWLWDFQADLLIGEGEKAKAFKSRFCEVLANRCGQPLVKMEMARLVVGRNLFGAYRNVTSVRLSAATGAVFISALGEDLYISTRVFARPGISQWRLLMWLLISGMIAGVLSLSTRWAGNGREMALFLDENLFVKNMMVVSIILASILSVLGFLRADGDLFAFWRARLNELDRDDLAGLSLLIYQTLVLVADEFDIDSTQLASNELPAARAKRL